MKILYATRLFSGLEPGLLSRRWEPRGAPTSYKLIEALDRSEHELHLVFTAAGSDSPWSHDSSFRIQGLSASVTVLAGEPVLPRSVRGRRGHGRLREARQLARLLDIVRRVSPDLAYFSRANIWVAAMLARYSHVPVVLRVMGIYPDMRDALDGESLECAALRWAYRSPFASVIATQDGSGVEPWLRRTLRPGVPWTALVNGVDASGRRRERDARFEVLPDHGTKVLFLGRLHPHKGCRTFLEGFLRAWQCEPDLRAVIAGEGPEELALRKQVASAAAEHAVTFLGELPHDQVMAIHGRTDVYVSLNELGNLSNANLEAMYAGNCIVMPASQPGTGIDVVTDRLVPDRAVWRLASAHDVEGLAEALVTLHRDADRRRRMGREMSAVARTFIPSWDERVRDELVLLERLVAGRSPTVSIREKASGDG